MKIRERKVHPQQEARAAALRTENCGDLMATDRKIISGHVMVAITSRAKPDLLRNHFLMKVSRAKPKVIYIDNSLEL